jgi:putative FmdB family regulatory protein
MPTYEYHCDACEHEFEEFQSMSESALTKCPKCGKKKLRRLFGTGAAVLFKGSGFYQTDYRSESYKAAAKADQEKTTSSTDGAPSANGTPDTGAKASDAKPAKSGGKTSKSAAKSTDD